MRGFLILLRMDLRRSGGIFLSAGLGILLTAALLSFLLGFYRGVEKKVLPSFIPLDRLELKKVEHHFKLGPLSLGLGSEGIGEQDLEALRKLKGLREIYPGLSLAVPAVATGGMGLLGASFSTELAVQGLDPDLVRDDVAEAYRFESRAEGGGTPCRLDGDCDSGLFCAGPLYEEGICRPPIPVLISPRLMALFNSGIRRAYHLPRINPEALIGLKAEVDFGASTLGVSGRGKILRDYLQLVGFSERATPLGVSVPLEEVRRVHRFFGEGMQRGYDTVVLLFDSLRSMTRASARIPSMGFEAVDNGSTRTMSALSSARILLLLLASVILFISALGLFQAFVGLLERRREEISTLRAVGASRRKILALILVETALLSFLSALGGVFLGIASGRGMEALGHRLFPAIIHGAFYLADPTAFAVLILAIMLFAMPASAISLWIFLRRSMV